MNINEFSEKYKDQPRITEIIDFLKHHGYAKKDIRFNYEQAIIKEKIWIEKITKKTQVDQGNIVAEMYFPNNFTIVRLCDQQSKKYEGFYMKHCVSTYPDTAEIYSLRDENNIPKCTIELMNFEVIQIKGLLNGPVSPKYIQYVVDFLLSKNIPVSESEMYHLGYSRSDPEFKNFITTHFKNYHFKTFYQTEYFFIKNPLKIIKKITTFDNDLFLFFCEFGQSILATKQFIKNGNKIFYSSDMIRFINNAFLLACSNNQTEIAKILLKNNADPCINNGLPLFMAASKGNLKLVKLLLKNGADFQTNNYAAVVAATSHTSIFKYFVIKGFDIHTQSTSKNDSFGILYHACVNNNIALVKFLLNKGYQEKNQTQMISELIISDGSKEIISFLLKKFKINNQKTIEVFYRDAACENRQDLIDFFYHKLDKHHKKYKLFR